MLHHGLSSAAATAAGGPYAPLPPLPPPCHKDIPLSEDAEQEQGQGQEHESHNNNNNESTCPSTTNDHACSLPSLSFTSTPGVGVMSMRRPLAYRDKATAFGFLLHVLSLGGGVWVAAAAVYASSSSTSLALMTLLLPRLFFSILAGAALAYFVVLSPLLLHRRSVFLSRYVPA